VPCGGVVIEINAVCGKKGLFLTLKVKNYSSVGLAFNTESGLTHFTKISTFCEHKIVKNDEL